MSTDLTQEEMDAVYRKTTPFKGEQKTVSVKHLIAGEKVRLKQGDSHKMFDPVGDSQEIVEVFEMAEGGKLELVANWRSNAHGRFIRYGQIWKYTPNGSRLSFYMNHNFEVCKQFFNEFKRQFAKKD